MSADDKSMKNYQACKGFTLFPPLLTNVICSLSADVIEKNKNPDQISVVGAVWSEFMVFFIWWFFFQNQKDSFQE